MTRTGADRTLEPYADRTTAGAVLAASLSAGVHDETPVVIGLARGGVVVAAAVAAALGAPLDVLAVRKVGHPWHPEFALGAVAPGGILYLRDHDGISPEALAQVAGAAHRAATTLDRRLHRNRPAMDLTGHRCILVDDGLATGATMIAAIRWARHAGATHITAAVPVGAEEALRLVGHEADGVVCPMIPSPFEAVGRWYHSFVQVDDALVVALLDNRSTEPNDQRHC